MLQWNNIRLQLLPGGQESWCTDGYGSEKYLIYLQEKACRQFRLQKSDFIAIYIWKQSVDARDKDAVKLVFSLRFSLRKALEKKLLAKKYANLVDVTEQQESEDEKRREQDAHGVEHGDGRKQQDAEDERRRLRDDHRVGHSVGRTCNRRPLVVGSGPAGLFAALTLAEAGFEPIIFERGPELAERVKAVESFWTSGKLDVNANVQFGFGGAGTFSDGKLNTGIKDVRCRSVLQTFVDAGAPPEILYEAKPHVGTDKLRPVLLGMRKRIERLGGEFRFCSKLTGIVRESGQLRGVVISKGDSEYEISAEEMVLALGHSARDTFEMLEKCGIPMMGKAFSLGVRIEHRQAWLNKLQYGVFVGHPALGAADYRVVHHIPEGRSVYSFCMCPGGQVVAAASEMGGTVTNGMSLHSRDGIFANSALLVGVSPADFPGVSGVLGGVALQRQCEAAAFQAGGGDFRAPAQYVVDFLASRQSKEINPGDTTYRPGVCAVDFWQCLPEYICRSLSIALPAINEKMPGFISEDAVMTGVESRSSSPVRILRNELFESSVAGIYPCGEGAGYAGGIISAAVDGIRCAEAMIEKLRR